MKRILLSLVALIAVTAMAQQQAAATAATSPLIGYLSCDSVLSRMDERAIVREQMATMRQAYDDEMQRVEDEFNTKYEAFLDGQRDFPKTILLKRQNELQALLQQNVAFKQNARRELRRAEAEALKPLKARMAEAMAAVAKERGLLLIVNTDADACPWLDPELSVDVTEEVVSRLNSK